MNFLIVISLNFKFAPLHIRSAFQFDEMQRTRWYETLDTYTGVVGGALLSTCNRTEFYLETNELFSHDVFLTQIQEDKGTSIPSAFFQIIEGGKEPVKYAMEVANGLHSMVVGDKQIIGQVRSAYRESLRAMRLTMLLERMFQSTFRCFKEVHNKTLLHSGSRSISFLAVKKIQNSFSDNAQQPKVLLIGAGEIAADFLKYATTKKFSVMLTNRTSDRGRTLAERFGIPFIPYERFKTCLPVFDAIVSCASAKSIVKETDISKCRVRALIDLTTHGSIEVEQRSEQCFFTLDDLARDRAINAMLQQQALSPALAIIEKEVVQFSNWLKVRNLDYAD
jgi:glutamyl-tRNA reductase